MAFAQLLSVRLMFVYLWSFFYLYPQLTLSCFRADSQFLHNLELDDKLLMLLHEQRDVWAKYRRQLAQLLIVSERVG